MKRIVTGILGIGMAIWTWRVLADEPVQDSTIITNDNGEVVRRKEIGESLNGSTTLGTDKSTRQPSTIIASDKMEMVRREDLSEFHFWGNVVFKGKDFSGECDEMQVSSIPQPKQKSSDMGQIQEIVALGNVHLVTEDGDNPEKKESHSGEAHIFPGENKMVLTKNPVVNCAYQGKFAGEKITLYKDTSTVIVEGGETAERAQVELLEEPAHFASPAGGTPITEEPFSDGREVSTSSESDES
jgi:lipopolysaccharide export system protein LptA